jgi:hypothetical protein
MPHGPPGKRPRRVDRDQIKHDVVLGLMSGLPLTVIARRNGISQPTVENWKAQDPEFAEQISAARALGLDHLASECLTIIDDRSNDVVFDAQGIPHPNSAAVLRAKAQCDVRLKLLACWDSGRYGPTKTLRVEGEVQTTSKHVLDPRLMDDASRAALRLLLAHAEAQGLIEGPNENDLALEGEVIDDDELDEKE